METKVSRGRGQRAVSTCRSIVVQRHISINACTLRESDICSRPPAFSDVPMTALNHTDNSLLYRKAQVIGF